MHVFYSFLGLFSCVDAEQTVDIPVQEHQKKSLAKEFVSCREYADKEVFSYCIYQKAGFLDSVDDVEYYCSMAGKWEEGCRHTWGAKMVRSHQNMSFDDFMKGCGGFSDCAFEIIDAIPSKDIDVQLSRCQRYVIADRQDCIRHAMQRWINTTPSKQDFVRFLANDPYLDDMVLHYVAEHNYCRSWDLCTGQSNNSKKCRIAMKKIKKTRNPCRGKWGNMSK